MDLELSEEQQAIADLARRILSEELPPERVRAVETAADERWFAEDVWAALAKADLLGVCLPESDGGGGYGFLEATLLLEQQGRTVAPLPLWPTLVLGALPIARFGSAEQRAALLPGVAAGSTILTAALHESGDEFLPAMPTTTAVESSGTWRLHGEKELVPAAHLADRLLVPAATGDGSQAVFIVDPRDGVDLDRNVALSDEPLFSVRLDDAVGEPLGDPGVRSDVAAWISARAIVGLCAMQVGVCDGALGITSAYVSEREQFGSKIGTFQAVAQRLADAYIDAEAIRLTTLQAAWRLSEELRADDEVDIAKFWASDGGHRLVHACQHVHGGVGVDLDYPIHRYFRWSKRIEFTLGSATEHLRLLGRRIATSG